MFIEDKNLIHLYTRQQEPESNILPIIMCMRERVCNFSRVIAHLDRQDFKKLHQNVWDRTQELANLIRKIQLKYLKLKK